jgi:hypothetical protein
MRSGAAKLLKIPHLSLIVALSSGVAALFLHPPAQTPVVVVHVGALSFWGYQELVGAKRRLRRLIGAGFLMAVVVVLAIDLAG